MWLSRDFFFFSTPGLLVFHHGEVGGGGGGGGTGRLACVTVFSHAYEQSDYIFDGKHWGLNTGTFETPRYQGCHLSTGYLEDAEKSII